MNSYHQDAAGPEAGSFTGAPSEDARTLCPPSTGAEDIAGQVLAEEFEDAVTLCGTEQTDGEKNKGAETSPASSTDAPSVAAVSRAADGTRLKRSAPAARIRATDTITENADLEAGTSESATALQERRQKRKTEWQWTCSGLFFLVFIGGACSTMAISELADAACVERGFCLSRWNAPPGSFRSSTCGCKVFKTPALVSWCMEVGRCCLCDSIAFAPWAPGAAVNVTLD
ncbi:hypothetical protein LTR16_008468, partial [Cryomyces antarcticus]